MAYQLMPLILDAIINQKETHGSNVKQIIEYISSEKLDDISPNCVLSVDVPRTINKGLSTGVLYENSPGRYKINVYGLFKNPDTESEYDMKYGRNCFGFVQAQCPKCPPPKCPPPECCKPKKRRKPKCCKPKCCKPRCCPPRCSKPCGGCCYSRQRQASQARYRKMCENTPRSADYLEEDSQKNSAIDISQKNSPC